MGVACWGDALVSRGYPTLLPMVFGGLVHGQPPCPVVFGVPTRGWRHTHQIVFSPTNRHFANGFVRDMALDVGQNHVLHGRVVILERCQKVFDTGDLAATHPCHQGVVVMVQSCPAQGQHKLAGVDDVSVCTLRVTQHRAMACATNSVKHIGFAFDANTFLARLKSLPAIRCLVLQWVGGVDFFQIQVLHIGAGVGKAPSHMVVVTQDHQRHARQGGAYDVLFGGLQVGVKPNGRCAQTQMGVVSQQGLARSCAIAGNYPVVAALAFHQARLA